MKIEDLLHRLRQLAPEETALDGDPVGLLIEPARSDIRTVVVCLDCTAHIAHIARETGADLVIAHHPLIYHPLRRLSAGDPIASAAMSLVRAGVGLYAMHTNWDAADMGINDTLAAQIGLSDVRRLGSAREAALARIGSLAQPLALAAFLDYVSGHLDCSRTSTLRHTRPQIHPASVRTVAVCGGAGAFLVPEVIKAGADAFVTADVRHHEFVDAASRGLILVDAGHAATEAPGMQNLASILTAELPDLSLTFVPNWAA